MRWLLAVSLVLLAASAIAQGQDEPSWSATLGSWRRAFTQQVNQIGKQANAVRDAIGRRLESLNATLQGNDDLVAQIVPAETMQAVNDAIDVFRCLMQPDCRLRPSMVTDGRSRRAIMAASRELTSAERRQASAFLEAVGSRVKREVLGDVLDFANRVSDGLNEALEKVRDGVQQARDGVEQVRTTARGQVTATAERLRSMLRCYLALACDNSQPARAARSAADEREIANRATGALILKRSLRSAWQFDSGFVRTFISTLVNSESVADVDRAVDLLRDVVLAKINDIASLVSFQNSPTVTPSA